MSSSANESHNILLGRCRKKTFENFNFFDIQVSWMTKTRCSQRKCFQKYN